MRAASHAERSASASPQAASRDELVLKHLQIVKAIAAQVRQKLPEHVDLDDLIQAGTLGLLDAADKFDATKSVAFSTYAKHRIKGAIIDSLRQVDWASRELRARKRRVDEWTRELSAQLNRPPLEEEIAEKMDMSLECWRRMMLDLRVEFCSVPPHPGADRSEGGSMQDLPDSSDHLPDRLCAQNQLREALGLAVRTLSERERSMLALHYCSELPMREISEIFGVHESRTSQIHKAALRKLAVVFRAAGIHSSSL